MRAYLSARGVYVYTTEQAVGACERPGVSVVAVALARGINVALLRRWVKEAERSGKPIAIRPTAPSMAVEDADGFVPITLPSNLAERVIRIELRGKSRRGVSMQWPASLAGAISKSRKRRHLMIGLAVYLNGKKLTVAGADDLCVLNAIVNAVGELGKATERVGRRRSVDLWLTVGGLTRRAKGAGDEHLRWLGHKRLRVGDKITVRVVQTDRPDKHKAATLAVKDRKMAAARMRHALKRLKKDQPVEKKASRR